VSGEWLPLIAVLVLGLVSGLAAALLLRRSPTGDVASDADHSLALADLERRRDNLYARLRSSEDEADLERLEISAARVLRDIDRLQTQSPGLVSQKPPAVGEEPEVAATGGPAAATSQAVGTSGGHPMLVGFLAGGAMVALIGVLIFWALNDAQPDPNATPQRSGAMMDEDHPTSPLPPAVQQQIDVLRAQLDANPTDLMAYKQLALALLSAEQYFEAFEMAQRILASFPDDPDGLYISGMVRITMGQSELAMEQLDRVLEQYPNHVLAMTGRGMVFMSTGDLEAAALVFERALAAAGGRHPDLEQLLAAARQGEARSASSERAAPAPAKPGPSIPPPSAAPSVAADSYGVRVELASGLSAPPSATLFVFLRDEAGGPPSAVRRIQSPSFPLEVTLGPDQTMLGRPMPTSGMLSVRLDADGSASTHDESDLSVETAVEAGSHTRVVLGQ
jgi:tetratricopeptide (TPR) repeat protein